MNQDVKWGITGSSLKIIAIITMFIDHTAAVLLSRMLFSMGIVSLTDYSPAQIAGVFEAEGNLVGILYLTYQIMRRIIGRMAFPIFCFLLVEGFQRTGNKKKYIIRLFMFVILSEIPFDLAFHGTVWYPQGQNVFITLLLGFLVMTGFELLEEKKPGTWIAIFGKIGIFIVAAVVAELCHCDYGAKGVMVIVILYLFRRNKAEQLVAGCVALYWKLTAMLAFIPIAFYNGQRGLRLKYIFYVFYPVHLLILYGLAEWIFG